MKVKLISDTIGKWKDKRVSKEKQSCYIRKSWMLSTKSILKLPKMMTNIRFFDEREAQELHKIIKKRNVFASTSWENNFYLKRIEDLANTTVIEIFRPGNIDDMIDEAQKIADLIEKLAILSSSLIMPRETLQRKLAISSHHSSVFDITIQVVPILVPSWKLSNILLILCRSYQPHVRQINRTPMTIPSIQKMINTNNTKDKFSRF